MRAGTIGYKVEQLGDITVIDATILSLAKETKSSTIADSNKVCSNGKSRKNECSNSMPKLVGRVCISIRPIYYGDG